MSYNPSRIREIWSKVVFDKITKDEALRVEAALGHMKFWYPVTAEQLTSYNVWYYIEENSAYLLYDLNPPNLLKMVPPEWLTNDVKPYLDALWQKQLHGKVQTGAGTVRWLEVFEKMYHGAIDYLNTTPNEMWGKEEYQKHIPAAIRGFIESGAFLWNASTVLHYLQDFLTNDLSGPKVKREEIIKRATVAYNSLVPWSISPYILHFGGDDPSDIDAYMSFEFGPYYNYYDQNIRGQAVHSGKPESGRFQAALLALQNEYIRKTLFLWNWADYERAVFKVNDHEWLALVPDKDFVRMESRYGAPTRP